ncbi:MAG TPA: hypothetical protein PKD15_00920 [Candidatus Saccharibacteria bacterium]|nr:hypothetical protein [Candidatus Saccharibacteria bacterium]
MENETPTDNSINTTPSSPPAQTIATQNPPLTTVQTAPPEQIPQAPTQKFKNKKSFILIAFVAILLMGGGAAAYMNLYLKSPEKLWSRAMKNTVNGLDSYLDESTKRVSGAYTLDGSFNMESPTVIDGTMSGLWDEKNGSVEAEMSVMGTRISAELRMLTAENADVPDIYAKVDGLKSVEALLGLTGISDVVNNKWFYIDHTLLEQATASSANIEQFQMSPEDLQKIYDNMMVVMNKRFFATDQNAVFTLSEKVGKEKFEDTDAYKLKVGVDKENLKSFVTELKDAMKDTKFEELLLANQDGKSLEDILSFESLLKEIEDADMSKAYAHVWVEANGAFVRNVRIYPVEGKESSNYLDFGLNYEGGNKIPLQVKATIDDEGTKGTLGVAISLDKETADMGIDMDVDMDSGGQPLKMGFEMSFTGTDKEVKIETPSDATNALELMNLYQSQINPYGQSIDDYDYDSLDVQNLYDDYELMQ